MNEEKEIKGNLTYFEGNHFHTIYGTLIKHNDNVFELKKDNGKLVIGNLQNWIFEES